jgi:hypothetical protein
MGVINFIKYNIASILIVIISIIMWIVLLIIPGVHFVNKKYTFNGTTSGKIVKAICQPSEYGGKICNIVVNYKIEDRYYTGVNVDVDGKYSQGDSVTVYYDSVNPTSFIIKQYNLQVIGLCLLITGILLILIAIFSFLKNITNQPV